MSTCTLEMFGGHHHALNYVWDVTTLAPALMTQPGGSTGSGGDASAANQTTEIAKLTSLDGKAPALGQALAAGSVPVVLTAAQVSTLTPPAAITGFSTETTLAGIKTGTDKIPAAPAQEHTTAASPHAMRLSDGAAFFKPTTPSDTQPVSAASLPLPTGASTETTLSAMSGKLPASVGQKTMAASLPIVIASDQSAVPTTKVPTGGTNVLKTGTLTTTAVTADQVVLTYTVTALKTFYLTYLVMYGRLTVLAATATILGAISLETPSGTKTITFDDVNPTTSELEFNPLVFSEPIPIAAGTVVRVVVTPAAATSMLWRANFGGYEK